MAVRNHETSVPRKPATSAAKSQHVESKAEKMLAIRIALENLEAPITTAARRLGMGHNEDPAVATMHLAVCPKPAAIVLNMNLAIKLATYGFWIRIDGKEYRAHRVALSLKGVAIPDGMMALHKCNRPACVNPDHLYVGTHNDNMAQASRDGRFGVRRGRILKLNCPKCGGDYVTAPSMGRICVTCTNKARRDRWSKRKEAL